jgi:hypothetical protein
MVSGTKCIIVNGGGFLGHPDRRDQPGLARRAEKKLLVNHKNAGCACEKRFPIWLRYLRLLSPRYLRL